MENRLTDAVLDMADKLIGGMFAKARNATRQRYVASAGDVGRLMRLFHDTIEALVAAQKKRARRLRGRRRGGRLAKAAARARGRAEPWPIWPTKTPWSVPPTARGRCANSRPTLIEALDFRAARANDPMLAALELLRDLNQAGKREIPPDAPMPFRKEWKRLVLQRRASQIGGSTKRAVLATLRDKLRSGDVWVERSANYRRFDSYPLPPAAVPKVAAELGLPATADEWLAAVDRNSTNG